MHSWVATTLQNFIWQYLLRSSLPRRNVGFSHFFNDAIRKKVDDKVLRTRILSEVISSESCNNVMGRGLVQHLAQTLTLYGFTPGAERIRNGRGSTKPKKPLKIRDDR